MSVIALIPARAGSKGIVNKNINLICGLPLISYSINQALRSPLIDKVIVSTDSEIIREIAINYGAECPFLRPSNISMDSSSTEDVIKHLIHTLNLDKSDTIVLLQPTSPVRFSLTINDSINYYFTNSYDSIFSCSRFDRFLWKKSNNSSPISCYDFRNRPRRQELNYSDSYYFENGSIYIFNVRKFIEYNNRLYGNIGAFEMSSAESFEIDDEFDLLLVKQIVKNYYNEIYKEL